VTSRLETNFKIAITFLCYKLLLILVTSVEDPNLNPDPNPNRKGSDCFEGSKFDQTIRILILLIDL